MITKVVHLECNPDRAFALFTEEAGRWWPPDRRHTDDANSIIRMEPSGRFFERAGDGSEVELGAVRVFEPGARLVLDWYPGTDRANATLVEIRFEPAGEGTLLTVTHSLGAATSDAFVRNAPGYDRSWDLVLGALARSSVL